MFNGETLEACILKSETRQTCLPSLIASTLRYRLQTTKGVNVIKIGKEDIKLIFYK